MDLLCLKRRRRRVQQKKNWLLGARSKIYGELRFPTKIYENLRSPFSRDPPARRENICCDMSRQLTSRCRGIICILERDCGSLRINGSATISGAADHLPLRTLQKSTWYLPPAFYGICLRGRSTVPFYTPVHRKKGWYTDITHELLDNVYGCRRG